jgi:ribonuclease E
MGLVEIARQRLRAAKMGSMYTTCPNCDGYGLIKNLEAAALAALRKLQTRGARTDVGKVRVKLPADVATWMLNNKREDLLQIEQRNQLRVEIEPSEVLLRHEVGFETFPRERTDEPAPRVVRDRVPIVPPIAEEVTGQTAAPASAAPAANEPAAAEETEPAEAPKGRKRRRRRRRGGADSEQTPDQKTEDTPAAGPIDDASATSVEQPKSSGAPEARRDDEEAAPAAPSGEAAAGAGDDVEKTGGKRRRRRRRRRPRGDDDLGNGAAAAEPEHGEASQSEIVVPGHVKSDELMPAAVGGSQRKGSRREPSGTGRRRRG